MIISHKKKFLFIHIYKNAGTSIQVALLPHCIGLLHSYYVRFSRKFNIPIPKKINPYLYGSHSKAKDINEKMGSENFQQYFSFAVVRNPWDWQVSQYKFMRKNPKHFQHEFIKKMTDFDEYIRWRCTHEVRFQKDFVCSDNDELLVNFIARFEKLDSDFGKICSILGIDATLPKLNVSNNIPYQKFYTDETRDLISKTFARDIEYFEYKFE
ncbi:MAG: transposase [Balneolaceae bacterium]|nr:MAG: transposase [Balneolaceae bacterium]